MPFPIHVHNSGESRNPRMGHHVSHAIYTHDSCDRGHIAGYPHLRHYSRARTCTGTSLPPRLPPWPPPLLILQLMKM